MAMQRGLDRPRLPAGVDEKVAELDVRNRQVEILRKSCALMADVLAWYAMYSDERALAVSTLSNLGFSSDEILTRGRHGLEA